MRSQYAIGPRLYFFVTTLVLVLTMGYVVVSCLKRKSHQPYIDVCEISSQKLSSDRQESP